LKGVSQAKVFFEEGHNEKQIEMFDVGVAVESPRDTWEEFKVRYKCGNKRARIDVKISLEDVLPFVYSKSGDKRRVFLDKKVKMRSSRLELFASEEDHQGITCNACGVEGKYFYLERNQNNPKDSYHLNLYGIDGDGDELVLTKDHIIPKSKGGDNNLSNYQTLCYPCNHEKADDHPEEA
jgi:hypothetical protein